MTPLCVGKNGSPENNQMFKFIQVANGETQIRAQTGHQNPSSSRSRSRWSPLKCKRNKRPSPQDRQVAVGTPGSGDPCLCLGRTPAGRDSWSLTRTVAPGCPAARAALRFSHLGRTGGLGFLPSLLWAWTDGPASQTWAQGSASSGHGTCPAGTSGRPPSWPL